MGCASGSKARLQCVPSGQRLCKPWRLLRNLSHLRLQAIEGYLCPRVLSNKSQRKRHRLLQADVTAVTNKLLCAINQ